MLLLERSLKMGREDDLWLFDLYYEDTELQ